MTKVYNAIYRTNSIYAEGYIAIYDDNSIEGIFALDYMHIYEYGNNSFCFIKTYSYYTQNDILMEEKKLHEFYSSKQTFLPPGTYFFFNNSGNILSLEINEEVTDLEDSKLILMDIATVRS